MSRIPHLRENFVVPSHDHDVDKIDLDLQRESRSRKKTVVREKNQDISSFYCDLVGLKERDSSKNNEGNEGFFCEACEERIRHESSRSHYSSTMHQFCLKHNPSQVYFIDPGNPGYQLLKKGGWNEEKGIGKNEQGRINPVKTRLKRERFGLGHHATDKVAPLRVTHFKSVISTANLKEIPHDYHIKRRRRTLKAALKADERAKKKRAAREKQRMERIRAEIYDRPVWPPIE